MVLSGMRASGSTKAAPPRKAKRRGEWRVFVALAVVACGLIGGLYGVARDAASSRSNSPRALPTPVISDDEACANFARYWMVDSGVAVDATVIEGLTNCRLSSAGEWFVPSGPWDPRLPAGSLLTESEREQTAALKSVLLTEIAELEASLSPSIEQDIKRIYDPRARPVSGHLRDGEMIGRARDRYTRVAQAFFLDPEHQLLADYAGWLMAGKIAAYQTLLDACQADPALGYLSAVCLGLGDSLSVGFPPWTWELRNAVSLETYLASLVRSDRLAAVNETRDGTTIGVTADD